MNATLIKVHVYINSDDVETTRFTLTNGDDVVIVLDVPNDLTAEEIDAVIAESISDEQKALLNDGALRVLRRFGVSLG
jgi:hypothetical protein